MLDLPLHPTLFVSLAILVGFAISPLLAYVDKNEEINNSMSNATQFLTATWLLAGVFAILLFSRLFIGDTQTPKALAPLGMMIAALIASASVMKNISETKVNEELKYQRDINKETTKNIQELSKFYLDKCADGLAHFYELLKDGNNDRATWLQASRILLVTQELSEKITVEAHKNIYEIEVSKTRFALFSLFKNPINGSNINDRFFFGGDYWKNNLPSFDSLVKAIPSINTIEEYSATVIFKFLDYPENYSDPLRKFNPKSIDFNNLLWQKEPRKHLATYIQGLENYSLSPTL